MKRTFWKKALTFALSAALAVSASAVAFADGETEPTTSSVAKVEGKYYDSLSTAVASVTGTEQTTVTMLSDYVEENEVKIADSKNIVVDLNGHTVTFDKSNEKKIFLVDNGTLTITGTGIVKEGSTIYYSPVMTLAGEGKTNTVVIDENVVLEGWSGIFINQDGANVPNHSIITMNGTIHSIPDSSGDKGAGIYINGTLTKREESTYPVLNIGGTISSEGHGIYAAGYSDISINNGTNIIGGETGIEIRAGKLTVNDGATVIGKGKNTVVVPNNNGATTDGAGIAVAQHTTKLPIDVTINGGMISGNTALKGTDTQGNNDAANVKINVQGGNFTGATAVDITGCTASVTGGTFSDPSALAYAANGSNVEIVLQNDKDMGDTADEANDINVPAGSNVVVDMGGHTLKGRFRVYGNLTLKNGTLNFNSPNNTAAIWVYNSGNLVVANNATIQTTDDNWGVGLWKTCTDAKVTINGDIIAGNGFTTNGDIAENSNNVIVFDGATITANDEIGIYHAGMATTTIKNSTITGKVTGMEVRAGDVTVGENVTIIGNGVPTTVTPNGNGTTTDGAGVAIAQHTTQRSTKVTINSGATISGYSAVYESNPQGNETVNKVNLTITGGTFNAIHGGTVALYSEDCTKFVTGGTFSSNVQTYCADGYYSVHTAENEWTVLPAGGLPITLDIASVSKIEGEKNPAFSVSTKDKVAYGDDINNYFVCTRDEGEAVGTYTIHAVEKNLPKYYKVIGTNQGTLTIMPKPGIETGTTDTVVVPEPPKVDVSTETSTVAKEVADNLEVDEEAVISNGVVIAQELEKDEQNIQNAKKALEDAGVTIEGQDTVLLVVKPYVEVKPTTTETSADGNVQKVNLEITLKYDVHATIPGKKTVEISTGNTMSKEQIKADTTITVPVPTGFATTEAIVRHDARANGYGIQYYSTKLTDGKFEFTVPAEHGFSPFTLMSNASVTVKLDGKNYTYTSRNVAEGTALPALSKNNYAFKGWKFDGIDGQHFNMTAELFEELLDKNAVVVGSSVFEGPLSEHPEIEEAKKNGTWGVDENKPAPTAKPAAAAAVTPVRSSIPKTSDDSNLMLWVCLMGLAALGLGGALYLKKRNSK